MTMYCMHAEKNRDADIYLVYLRHTQPLLISSPHSLPDHQSTDDVCIHYEAKSCNNSSHVYTCIHTHTHTH